MALLLVLCVAGTLTACSSDSNTDTKRTARPPSKPAKDKPTKSAGPRAKEKQAVLEVYDRMWEEQVKAYAKGDHKGTDLKKYATKEALGGALGDLLSMEQAGTATKGAPTHSDIKVSMDLNREVPTARITDCLDISKWQTIKESTGKVQPFPTEQELRYETTADAERWGKNRWMITKLTPHGNKVC
ncbi:hypothetical protein [Streptomyces sp. BA2]|uniref:hypothetical protein n=1 Tax=Streptomyces sp. BA2 TaxID=436595 RepID=UPI001F2C40D9|nr:hypothetical protein [Streptomyces sp. BA2]